MYTLVKPLEVREKLLEKGIKVFTPREFGNVFSLKNSLVKHFLENQTRKGFLLRLKRGLYALNTDQPGEEEVANIMYRPSYLSLEYALSIYGIIPETVYEVTSVTTKPTRVFETMDRAFSYYSIKVEAYTGYSLMNSFNKSYLIADKEKALADYFYFQALGKRSENDRIDLGEINKSKLLGYAKLFKNKKLLKIIDKTYANK